MTASTAKAYLAIARLDHWTKNVFVLPGFFFAALFVPNGTTTAGLPWLVVGLFATGLIASANYTINEWLDREFDRFHPLKKHRPAVSGMLSGRGVSVQYALLAAAGLGIALTINVAFSFAALALLLMGLIYNVKPIRSKDRVYLDVVSEAVNNPIRLSLGWFILMPNVIPPSSLLISYWFGGAFLMAVKRLAEFRYIKNPKDAGNYRRSFTRYDESRLLASGLFYAIVSFFFMGVFLVRYRIELLVVIPFYAMLFPFYLMLGLRDDSPAQRPEHLFKEIPLISYLVVLVLMTIVVFVIDMPFLREFLENKFPEF